MPVLKNARQEKFAQGLATGLTGDAAYTAAGYKPDRGNAARLTANDIVSARVAELQKRAEAKFELSRLDWLESFARLARKAEKAGDFTAARGCLREIGLALSSWYAPQKAELAVDTPAAPKPSMQGLLTSQATLDAIGRAVAATPGARERLLEVLAAMT